MQGNLKTHLNYVVADHQGFHVNTVDILLDQLFDRSHAKRIAAAVALKEN